MTKMAAKNYQDAQWHNLSPIM